MLIEDIHIRDPYVVLFENRYYMIGTRGVFAWGKGTGFDCFISDDLVNWSDPIPAFIPPDDFYKENHWAPEIHRYKNDFYVFMSVKDPGMRRGTLVLKSASGKPEGPYEIYSDIITPTEWECLDGTLYVNPVDETPYMVFCHEWTQCTDGEICAVKMTGDLKYSVGEPILLFAASSASWYEPTIKNGLEYYVTDGPFLFYDQSGCLSMLWSGLVAGKYVITVSKNKEGLTTGTWLHEDNPFFMNDGGHGMIFTTKEGNRMLSIHAPNQHPAERPLFLQAENL